jgi:hypothetical protein
MRPPSESVARAAELADPAWVVFPAFRPEEPMRLTPHPRSRALVRLARNSFNWNLLGVHGFEALSTLVDRSGCYELTYRDLVEALRALEELPTPKVPAPATDTMDRAVRVSDS